jgi:hypothetical protein
VIFSAPCYAAVRFSLSTESAQQFHNGRGHDARLVKFPDGEASVLDSTKEKNSSVQGH